MRLFERKMGIVSGVILKLRPICVKFEFKTALNGEDIEGKVGTVLGGVKKICRKGWVLLSVLLIFHS